MRFSFWLKFNKVHSSIIVIVAAFVLVVIVIVVIVDVIIVSITMLFVWRSSVWYHDCLFERSSTAP